MTDKKECEIRRYIVGVGGEEGKVIHETRNSRIQKKRKGKSLMKKKRK